MDVDTDRAVLEAWLILLRAPGLGPAALRGLIARYGNATTALAAARRDHSRAIDAVLGDWLRAPDAAVLARDLEWLGAPDHALLTFEGADFPVLLNEIPSPPAALFVIGDPSALWRPQVAVVGSRNASQGGAATATAFSRALAGAGFAITSGLAEGIDAAAHGAALAAGGSTIAVLGTGADLVYPARHRDLAARIAERGAVVSEFATGTPAHPSHFPRRNRIIAGLSLGTLVVEAGVRSGSLITARNATESGREVFAIPGSIHNPLARGCHQLIRQGATLVETAEEVIGELAALATGLAALLRERLLPVASADDAMHATTGRSVSAHADDPDYARLLRALGHDAIGIDRLAERSGLAVSALSSMLLMLELEGEVVIVPGGAYARAPGAAARAAGG